MFDLRKLFVREARARRGDALDPDSDYHPSEAKGEGVEVEYQALIATQFRRWGITTSAATVEVRRIGRAPDGFDVLVGMVRLTRWERFSAMRLLVGLPLLEHKIRKTVRGTWLADYSHFGGLWLHSSEQLNTDPEAVVALRDALHALAPSHTQAAASPDAASAPGAPATTGFSSLGGLDRDSAAQGTSQMSVPG